MPKKVKVIDSMHKGELLLDKVLRLRYPDYPDCNKPKASYQVISCYLRVPYNRIMHMIKYYKNHHDKDPLDALKA